MHMKFAPKLPSDLNQYYPEKMNQTPTKMTDFHKIYELLMKVAKL